MLVSVLERIDKIKDAVSFGLKVDGTIKYSPGFRRNSPMTSRAFRYFLDWATGALVAKKDAGNFPSRRLYCGNTYHVQPMLFIGPCESTAIVITLSFSHSHISTFYSTALLPRCGYFELKQVITNISLTLSTTIVCLLELLELLELYTSDPWSFAVQYFWNIHIYMLYK